MYTTVARPHGGVSGSLETLKRVRIDGTTSYNPGGNFDFNPGIPGPNAIGINGQATNTKINVQIQTILKAVPYLDPLSVDWIKEMMDECLIFIKLKWPQIPKKMIEGNRVATLCLPQLHYHLHELALREEAPITPAYVRRAWRCMGALQSHPQIKGTPEGQLERAILVQPKADTRIKCIWGPQVKGGDHLFLVLMEVEVTPDTLYVTSATGLGRQKPGIRGAKGGIIKYVTRFVPVVSDSSCSVAIEDRVYYKNCVRHIAPRPIYIGRVVNNPFWRQNGLAVSNVMDTRVSNNPTINYQTMLRCDPVEVYLSIS